MVNGVEMSAGDEFSGRVVVVTGAAAGIGSAIASRLARGGAHVAVNYRSDEAGARRTVDAIHAGGGRAMCVQGDVGDPAEVVRVADAVRNELGAPSLLVNNAAYTRILRPDELTPERFELMMRTNVMGPYLMTWALRRDMESHGGGSVVNISSMSGRRPAADMVAYGASKAALDYFTAAAALALAPSGIRVNGVAPGLVLTERAETLPTEVREAMAASVPLGRGGHPGEVAEVVAFLLSDRASYVSGQTTCVAGGSGF
jgi:NAD(P)-dependent dehydrogenase (short-subunit alcohol dehydrogenase family)